MKFINFVFFGTVAVVAVILGITLLVAPNSSAERSSLTIYLQNFDPAYVSNATLANDIPAWEQAANGAFRRVWNTPKVKLVLLRNGKSAPRGAEVMQFASTGPVAGAAAYHTQNDGRAAIVVYSGVDDMYGVSLSVSATHELFERLADGTTSMINQGWPAPYITISHGQFKDPDVLQVPPGQLFINEVCDPVEEDHYVLPGAHGGQVWISDWVTPNYFNDESNPTPGVPEYDYLGLVQQPLTILEGGYQSLFVVDYVLPNGLPFTGWVSVTNFRSKKDAAFFDAEKHGHVLREGVA